MCHLTRPAVDKNCFSPGLFVVATKSRGLLCYDPTPLWSTAFQKNRMQSACIEIHLLRSKNTGSNLKAMASRKSQPAMIATLTSKGHVSLWRLRDSVQDIDVVTSIQMDDYARYGTLESLAFTSLAEKQFLVTSSSTKLVTLTIQGEKLEVKAEVGTDDVVDLVGGDGGDEYFLCKHAATSTFALRSVRGTEMKRYTGVNAASLGSKHSLVQCTQQGDVTLTDPLECVMSESCYVGHSGAINFVHCHNNNNNNASNASRGREATSSYLVSTSTHDKTIRVWKTLSNDSSVTTPKKSPIVSAFILEGSSPLPSMVVVSKDGRLSLWQSSCEAQNASASYGRQTAKDLGEPSPLWRIARHWDLSVASAIIGCAATSKIDGELPFYVLAILSASSERVHFKLLSSTEDDFELHDLSSIPTPKGRPFEESGKPSDCSVAIVKRNNKFKLWIGLSYDYGPTYGVMFRELVKKDDGGAATLAFSTEAAKTHYHGTEIKVDTWLNDKFEDEKNQKIIRTTSIEMGSPSVFHHSAFTPTSKTMCALPLGTVKTLRGASDGYLVYQHGLNYTRYLPLHNSCITAMSKINFGDDVKKFILVTGDSKGIIRLWDVDTTEEPTEEQVGEFRGCGAPITSLTATAISSDLVARLSASRKRKNNTSRGHDIGHFSRQRQRRVVEEEGNEEEDTISDGLIVAGDSAGQIYVLVARRMWQ